MKFLEVLKILLFGIVEGITEWLPVSSTGHVILLDYFLPLQEVSPAFKDVFDYVIQLAAILAVVVLFWKQIFPFALKTTQSAETDDTAQNEKQIPLLKIKNRALIADMDILKLWLKVIIACVPAVFALFIDQLFENFSPLVESLIIACALIFYGVVFLLIESFYKKNTKIKEISELSYRYAFFIGCFQVLAAIPGTSRSGITIIGALILGLSRTAATEFTFFLAIPTMVGASGYKLLKFLIHGGSPTPPELGYLIIGSVVAFSVSLFAVKFLMNFVKKHDFKVFGWYRIVLGFIVILAMVIPFLVS